MPYLGKSPSFGVRQRYQYTATASQTTFSGTDTANLTLNYTDNNFVDVFQNGVLLKGGGNDYTATSGTSVVLATGATADDVIEIIVYDAFSAANFYSRTDSDSRYQTTLAGIDDQSSSNDDQITITDSTVVINEDSDDVDFRVESNGNANMLFVDGGNDSVVIGHNDANDGSVSSAFAFQYIGTDYNSSSMGLARFENSANAPSVVFHKSRNASIGGDTVVQDDDEMGRIRFFGNDGTDFTEGARITALVDGTPGNNDMPTRLTFSTTADGASGSTERVRITSAGELFIGTTSGSIGTSNFGCNIGDGTGGFAFSRNVTSSACMQIFGSNGEFRIIGNGNASNTNNSYGAISDLNLKENIADSGSQWDDIKAVKVKKYSLKKDKADKANMIGVIAQDLETSGMTGLVEEYEHEDTSTNWKKTGEVTKTVKYSVLYMKALKALQEAMTRIETLETKNDALEARIKKLEDG